MGLYTLSMTVELGCDTEATNIHEWLLEKVEPWAEVVGNRWYRDLDAEAAAAVLGVEWGGR